MRRKLHIECLVVLILLLATPVIPALQRNTITNTTNNAKNLTFDDNEEIKKSLHIKHPLAYIFVIGSLISRNTRIRLLLEYSYEEKNWPYTEIKHPVLYYRLILLVCMTHVWSGLWEYISNKFEWNWFIPSITENYL